ncbi:ATP-dependent DNA helicase MER3 [Pleomassaria siparia CBS 279.74]|uniref:DNA 3'-5' helicase n=1 Tax=Pleomassaria siparia CBS 279.74 TaxID=1314801 RepID=A0A6G1K0M1_9PLEO|nr:ATP-dependent DNA helicase MER3 [Pleomassaria siparia CBS 279.74]
MADDIRDLMKQYDHRVLSRNRSQYSMIHPQFMPPPRPVLARDRYRAPHRHEEAQYDDGVEDGEDNDLYGQVAPLDSCDERLFQQPIDDARFAYNPALHAELSSDAQLGTSSSPAFQAGQRRAENHQVVPSHPSIVSQTYRAEQQAKNQQHGDLHSRRQTLAPRPAPKRTELPHAPPVVQGIPLVFVTELPDRHRTVFPFPTFNAVQSKCFGHVYKSDDNFVLASPTGSGKTAILELAICRAINNNSTDQYKIVYQAPTKALCSERVRDWQTKFTPLGLKCVEITGDSDNADLRNVQTANIIITTPEKWDLITRRWKDHVKLMRLIKLFLIDEVHILKEDRGATLETVVSRMKTIGTDVRFVALSATVPNFDDVATWLGKNAAEPYEAAMNESFGEEFRPVKLRKHVCGYVNNCNDWMFDKFLDSKLPEVISQYSHRKPIMVFCNTRKSCQSTAKMLANWWISRNSGDQYWKAPSQPPQSKDRELRECAVSGVAFHHAGLELEDRLMVEKGFLNGEINVICCTSTLAVGVNLPCHFVIIKNTVSYGDGGLQEYADLEVMQMLGRAGRPQFDDSAIAVIMTRHTKVRHYEMMVTGQEPLESTLHLGLMDHLNAEIGLGTIHDLISARKWIGGTFLHVRLRQNPGHYKLEGARSGQQIDEQLDDICTQSIIRLQETDLVTNDDHFRCTDFGHAMARYYVHFETMKIFMSLERQARPAEILSAIANATEFDNIRFSAGEKNFYKDLNRSSAIRFPIPVNIAQPSHKISLMIQSALGTAILTWSGDMLKHKRQYTMELGLVIKHASRLIRCIIDCQISLGDSVGVRQALMLARSLAARAWDEGQWQLKQIEDVGPASIMKFTAAGIKSIEDLECTEPHKIENLMGRLPPFGLKILDRLKSFPKLRVSLQIQPGSIHKTSDGVKVLVKTDVGFLDDRPLQSFRGSPLHVCVLAETTDGRMMHFARISGRQLGTGQALIFSALLTSADQFIKCYVACDAVAGTQREAIVKPKIAPSMFPAPKPAETPFTQSRSQIRRPTPNMSVRRIKNFDGTCEESVRKDEFDDGIDDEDLMQQAALADLDFDHIENYANPTDAITRKNTTTNRSTRGKTKPKQVERPTENDDDEPRQLENGKWSCNHKCKDKNSCKHLCCREGLDKPPKKSTRKSTLAIEAPLQTEPESSVERGRLTQTKLQLTTSKRKKSAAIEELDLTQEEKKRKAEYATSGPSDYQTLHQLHEKIVKKQSPTELSSIMHKKPSYQYAAGGDHNLSFMDDGVEKRVIASSDYGDSELDDLSIHFGQPESSHAQKRSSKPEEVGIVYDHIRGLVSDQQSETYGDDESLFGEAMTGLVDSQSFQHTNTDKDLEIEDLDQLFLDIDDEIDLPDHDSFDRAGAEAYQSTPPSLPNYFATSSPVKVPKMPPVKGQSLFLNDTSSSTPVPDSLMTMKYGQKGGLVGEVEQTKRPQSKSCDMTLGKRNANEVQNFEIDENASKLGLEELDGLEKTDVKTGDQQALDIPDAFKDLEPWLFAEYGDVVELVDD